MLQMIIDWIITGIAEGMNLFCSWFFDAFQLDPAKYISYFPALATGYSIFRGLGYGLVFVFAVLGLLQFFVPSLFGGRQPDDRPLGVLFKAALASMLVFAGNYILEYIIELAKIPYGKFLNIGITGGIDFSLKRILISSISDLTGLSAALSIVEFALTAALAYNMLKLILEVCERYLMVAVLLYTSPPFFAMASSAATLNIFKSWLKMFVSSCAMMSVSVFFTKVVLSGLASIGTGFSSPGEVFLRLGLTFAMCKIAQHADEYLAKLGLGTATTGRPLWDDMMMAYKAVGNAFGGGIGGGSRSTIMGAMSRAAAGASTLASGVLGAADSIGNAYVDGSKESIMKDAAQGFQAGVENSKSPGAELIRKLRGEKYANVAGSIGNTAMNILSPKTADRKAAAAEAVKAETRKKEMEQESQKQRSTFAAVRENRKLAKQTGNEFVLHTQKEPIGRDRELLEKISMGKYRPGENEARGFLRRNGTGTGITLNENGDLSATSQAVAAGVSYHSDDQTWSGSSEAVAEIFARNYSDAELSSGESMDHFTENFRQGNSTEEEQEKTGALIKEAVLQGKNDMQTSMVTTVEKGPADIADRLAFDPRAELKGNEELGSAVASRIVPEQVQKRAEGGFTYFRTRNLDGGTAEGEAVTGGHAWSAVYTGHDGKAYEVTGINEEAYQGKIAKGEDVSCWTRTQSPETGRTMYISEREVSEDQLAEIREESDGSSTFRSSVNETGKDEPKEMVNVRNPVSMGQMSETIHGVMESAETHFSSEMSDVQNIRHGSQKSLITETEDETDSDPVSETVLEKTFRMDHEEGDNFYLEYAETGRPENEQENVLKERIEPTGPAPASSEENVSVESPSDESVENPYNRSDSGKAYLQDTYIRKDPASENDLISDIGETETGSATYENRRKEPGKAAQTVHLDETVFCYDTFSPERENDLDNYRKKPWYPDSEIRKEISAENGKSVTAPKTDKRKGTNPLISSTEKEVKSAGTDKTAGKRMSKRKRQLEKK